MMPAKKPVKRGRPELPKGEAKKVLPVRVDDNERNLFEKAAKKAGLNLSEWIRKTLHAEAER